MLGLVASFSLERAAISLDEKERGLTRAMAALFADGRITNEDWHQFSAMMTWADGRCSLLPDPGLADHKLLGEARQALTDLLKAVCDGHQAFLAAGAARVAAVRGSGSPLGREVARVLAPGARWMTAHDIAAGGVLTFAPSAAALIVRQEGRGVRANLERPGCRERCAGQEMVRNLSGYSGSPLWTVEARPHELFRFGGVVLAQFPARTEDDANVIFSRRAECIRPDGTLDRGYASKGSTR